MMTRMLTTLALSLALATPAMAGPKRQQTFDLDDLVALADAVDLDKQLRKAGLKDAGRAVDMAMSALSGEGDIASLASAWVTDAQKKGRKGKKKGRKGKGKKGAKGKQSSGTTTGSARR